jgi:uncharacterized protein YndB with AHSA1/START domain
VKFKKEPESKAGVKSAKKKRINKIAKKIIVKKTVKPLNKKVSAKKIIPKKIIKKLVKPAKPIQKVSTTKTFQTSVKSDKKKILNKTVNKNTVFITPAIKSKGIAKADKDKSIKIKELQKTEKVGINKVVLVKPIRKSKGGRKPKNKDDENEPVIGHDILIERLINSTKRLKKPSKIPKQLRTFTNPMASLTVANVDVSNKSKKTLPKKEPKGKFELEYVIRTSAGILYEFLTSPSGLSEWFADDVNIHDGVFTFFWEGSEQKAKLLGFKEEKFVRLQWLDKPEGTYFEFRIERDELTGDISLMIVDFADEAADMETSKRLWDSQINKLLNVIGSY